MVSDAKACNSESNVVLLFLRTGNHSCVYSSYLCCLSRYLTIVAPIAASSAWRAKKTDSRWKFETMTINGAHVVEWMIFKMITMKPQKFPCILLAASRLIEVFRTFIDFSNKNRQHEDEKSSASSSCGGTEYIRTSLPAWLKCDNSQLYHLEKP